MNTNKRTPVSYFVSELQKLAIIASDKQLDKMLDDIEASPTLEELAASQPEPRPMIELFKR